jgi:hypothetical protein
MDKKDIVIATITLARDEHEEFVLRKSLEHLAELDIPVYITDGGSRMDFLQFIKSFPHFQLLPDHIRGVHPQAKNSLNAAYRSKTAFIFYTEPDKGDFFHQLSSKIDQEIETDDRTGILLFSRSETAFATFPPFQQMTETTINNCCQELIGHAVDYTYGPFILKSELVPYLDPVREDLGWGWRPYIFGISHRLGFNTSSFTGPFSCPPDQREDNQKERIYRMRQLSQNIHGLVLSTMTALEVRR